jgi:Phospholipase_D-nuclease N-terminal
MGIFEILILIYLPFWLIAVIDATIGKFPRWYQQLGWLLVLFLVPLGNIAYLLFGCRQVAHGGLRLLRRERKEGSHE